MKHNCHAPATYDIRCTHTYAHARTLSFHIALHLRIVLVWKSFTDNTRQIHDISWIWFIERNTSI